MGSSQPEKKSHHGPKNNLVVGPCKVVDLAWLWT